MAKRQEELSCYSCERNKQQSSNEFYKDIDDITDRDVEWLIEERRAEYRHDWWEYAYQDESYGIA